MLGHHVIIKLNNSFLKIKVMKSVLWMERRLSGMRMFELML